MNAHLLTAPEAVARYEGRWGGLADLSALYAEYAHSAAGVRNWTDRALEPGLNATLQERYGYFAAMRQADADDHRDQIRAAVIAMSGLSIEQLREVLA